MHKLIKKYLYGGGLTSPTYTPAYNTGTDLYNNITNNTFNNISNLFYNNIRPTLETSNDSFGDKLQYDASTINALTNIASIGKSEGSSSAGTSSKATLKQKATKGLAIAGGLVSSMYDAIPTMDETINSNDEATQNIRKSVNLGLVSSRNPWLMGAGLVNTGIEKLGGFTDASLGLGSGIDTANKIASIALPGAGWFTKRTDKYKMSDTLKQNEAAYGGSVTKGRTAEQNANAKLLLGRNKANYLISEAKRLDRLINDIMNKVLDAFLASNNSQAISMRNQNSLNGVNWNKIHAAKEGLKLDRDFAKKVVKLSKGKKSKVLKIQEEVRTEEVAGFKNGGTVNVIPDGALHKNKHHLENVDEKFEEVTTKGIPVITEEKGGDIKQHAEVEREEIIFNLEVTKQLEKLMQDGSDEAAIEAGKLLVHEILENTVDNTGLLNTVE